MDFDQVQFVPSSVSLINNKSLFLEIGLEPAWILTFLTFCL
jgi:hypothetical protein